MNGISRREIAGGGLALSALMVGTRAIAQAAAASRDPLAAVDPELRAIARRMMQMGGGEPMNDSKLAATREGLKAYTPKPLDAVPVQKRVIRHLRGGPDVTVYVINARAGAPRPAIVHTHGGGYFSGSAEASIRYLQDTATAVDCVIVTVEYRLAPETRYNGSLEDNYSALRWLADNASEVGVDARRIAVMGESAGGGHAALLAQAARDRGETPLVFQCLVYPMLDDRIGSTRQLPNTLGTILWTAEACPRAWPTSRACRPRS
jgi:acetyl esterase/lipase